MKKLEQRFLSIQKEIFGAYSKLELSKQTDIIKDTWKRPEGGGGKTCVIQNGNFFDNSAVNFSSIYGSKLPKSALGNSKVKSTRYGFQAMGVSVICHPKNPNIPTNIITIKVDIFLLIAIDSPKTITEIKIPTSIKGYK